MVHDLFTLFVYLVHKIVHVNVLFTVFFFQIISFNFEIIKNFDIIWLIFATFSTFYLYQVNLKYAKSTSKA